MQNQSCSPGTGPPCCHLRTRHDDNVRIQVLSSVQVLGIAPLSRSGTNISLRSCPEVGDTNPRKGKHTGTPLIDVLTNNPHATRSCGCAPCLLRRVAGTVALLVTQDPCTLQNDCRRARKYSRQRRIEINIPIIEQSPSSPTLRHPCLLSHSLPNVYTGRRRPGVSPKVSKKVLWRCQLAMNCSVIIKVSRSSLVQCTKYEALSNLREHECWYLYDKVKRRQPALHKPAFNGALYFKTRTYYDNLSDLFEDGVRENPTKNNREAKMVDRRVGLAENHE